jgi:hypothetical protein
VEQPRGDDFTTRASPDHTVLLVDHVHRCVAGIHRGSLPEG